MDDNRWELRKDPPPAHSRAEDDGFYFDGNPTGAPDEELSAFRPGYDTPPFAPDYPAKYADDEAAQDEFLKTDVDLDEYLSYDEYERREDAAGAESVERRSDSPAKNKSGFLSFLKGRSPSDRKAADKVPEAVPMVGPDDYPDSDAAQTEAEEDYPAEYPDESERDVGRLYTVHGGSRGKAEQEARELIAELQAKSGVAPKRERRSAADYRVELSDLLGMENDGDDASPAYEPAPEENVEYDFDLDEALDYDADVKPYRGKNEAPVYRPDAAEPEIDERFNLSGQSEAGTISYDGSAVDLSADDEYVQAPQTEYNPSQWTPDYDDPLAERSDTAEPPRKQHRSFFGRARKNTEAASAETAEAVQRRDHSSAATEIRDENAGPAIYAVNAEYRDDPDYLSAPDSIDNTDYDDDDFDAFEDDDRSRKYRESDMYVPPSFKEYLLSILASVWLKLRGTVRGRTAETMSDTEEDLGPELTPAEASKYYGSFLRSMKYRLRISAGVLALLLYISMEMPVPGMMKSLSVDAAFCFGLQALILLLALDVAANGVSNAVRLHFGADSLAVVACFFTGVDALTVALTDTVAPHMPLCALSSISVVGLLLASYLSARGLRKATRVPAIGKHFFAVTGENTLEKDQITLLKSLRSVRGFVRRTEEAGPDETLYTRLAPVLFVLALVLSLVVMVIKKCYPEFLYLLSAHLAMAVPFGAMLSFALPFFLGSSRIFKFGAAIAGWSGLCDVGTSKNLIVTDRDRCP